MTLLEARLATEPGMIELIVGEHACEICCPDRLLFESYAGKPEWNYFRLELKKIYPALDGAGTDYLEQREELTEIQPGIYAPLNAWFENEVNGDPLADTARRITRFSGGSFVVFSTTSVYNRAPETYDARHNLMSTEEFRAYIHKNAKLNR